MQTDKIKMLPKGLNRKTSAHCCCASLLFFAFILLSTTSATAQMQSVQSAAQSVQVLSWWKSASEHKAVDVLATRLAQENIIWHDVVIPSGGIGEGIVLKSRVLSGTAPDIAQLKGPLIADWYERGLLSEFTVLRNSAGSGGSGSAAVKDSNNLSGKWDKMFFSTIADLVRPDGHLVAIPLGIHRMNTLFYNRKVMDRYGLRAPENWDEFVLVANKLQKEGIIPLAQSSEPWQVASLFETLLLSESSPEFYRRAFVKKDSSAFADVRFARALMRLRILKKYMPSPLKEITWVDATKLVAVGDAAMVVMGDFAKGELNAMGLATDINFGCIAVPNTGNYHIYNVDTLVMFSKGSMLPEVADKIAEIAVSPTMQTDYNMVKGSISVLRNADQIKMDSCARDSWKIFSRGSAVQVPSMAHDMATDGISKDAIIAEIVHFFMDDSIHSSETQRRLVAITRSLPKDRSGKDAQNINR